MTTRAAQAISVLFLLTAIYDGGLGIIFLLAPSTVFERAGVTPPNHLGYVQFPAALLLIFALMFIAVARDPVKHRDLIIYGMLLKLSYCSLTFWYWFNTDIPGLWKPFAVIDVVTAVLFAWAYFAARGTVATSGSLTPSAVSAG